ncbi:MAG TPA: putative toxin-antitoxin system toxin component, PIN family [Myxococcales bacterium]
MLRAVLDANVYISAIIQPGGTPGRLVERFLRDAAFDIVLSPAIVDEVLRALAYPKVRKMLRGVDAQLWFEDLVVLADLVPGAQRLTGICQDPDDDKCVAAALEGRATCVVTGDRAFLDLGEHAGVEILSPRAFLDRLGL